MTGKFGDIERITMKIWLTTIRTGSRLLTQQSSRSHLTARHTINGIIDEDNGNMLTAV